MTALALGSDAFRPQRAPGLGRGLALAVIAHVLLVIVLAVGVNWRTTTERDGVQAELWAAVPQVAAPRPAAETPPPPPPPAKPEPAPRVEPPPPRVAEAVPDAQIAIEKAKREERKRQELAEAQEEAERKAQRKAEKLAAAKLAAAQKKAEEQAAQQEKAASAAAAKKQELAAQKLEAQREANLQRMLAQAGAGEAQSPGRAAATAGPSADYIGRIKGRIRPNVSFPTTLEGNPSVEVEMRLAADGRILSARIVRPSGAREWDEAVQRGIEKTEILPRDENGRAPPSLLLVYKLRD